jgi:signal transduction histidine kinase
MNPSKNNGNLRADFASEDIEVSAERTAHATLKHGKRVLEQKLAERTQELNRSLVDVRSLTAALDAAQQSERTHLATELHDYLAQLLVLGRMKLGHLQRLPLPSTGDAIVQEVDDVFANAVEYCQTLMAELSPPIH